MGQRLRTYWFRGHLLASRPARHSVPPSFRTIHLPFLPFIDFQRVRVHLVSVTKRETTPILTQAKAGKASRQVSGDWFSHPKIEMAQR
jgi:hypothetical protein